MHKESSSSFGSETTLELLRRARSGEPGALDRLVARYLTPLQRWASGRLPHWARALLNTDDLVQDTLLQTIGRVHAFEPRHEGALQAYLRQAVLNRIHDEIRRVRRRPAAGPVSDDQVDQAPSPLDEVVGLEAMQRYEAALQRLRPEDREIIVARVEMGLGYEQLVQVFGKPSVKAARMMVSRALVRLAEEMRRGG